MGVPDTPIVPIRRLFIASLSPGRVVLDSDESHHARNVLRLQPGDTVELFDRAGRVAAAHVSELMPELTCEVTEVRAAQTGLLVHVASAVPKGDRADWMVEKLSELGVASWTPLRTARSVVHPEGKSKLERWNRIAIESAKQSRRAGLMEIRELCAVERLRFDRAAVLSTRDGAVPIARFRSHVDGTDARLTLLIGPEGGWTDEELDALAARGVREASLTDTVLRIETAAVVSAAVVLCTSAESPS
jgi:16S rRNA (uracil1498-N3)-methyltransferase